jgi:hypothetical protein
MGVSSRPSIKDSVRRCTLCKLSRSFHHLHRVVSIGDCLNMGGFSSPRAKRNVPRQFCFVYINSGSATACILKFWGYIKESNPTKSSSERCTQQNRLHEGNTEKGRRKNRVLPVSQCLHAPAPIPALDGLDAESESLQRRGEETKRL